MKTRTVVLLAVGFSWCHVWGSENRVIDLQGSWNLELVSCLETEPQCRLNMQNQARFQVTQPANLHEIVPWFYGRARLSRKFTLPAEVNYDDPALLIGPLGSVDQVFLNAVSIGQTGSLHEGQRFSSAWMKPRLYPFSREILRHGQNEVVIELQILDPKAGIHAGPVSLGSYEDLRGQFIFQKFLQTDFHILTLGTLLVAIIVFLATFASIGTERGKFYILLAFAGYLLYSLYFLEIALPVGHLQFLKIVMIGRVVSAYINGVWIQYLLTGHVSRKFVAFLWSITGVFSLLIVLSGSYTVFIAAMQVFYASIVAFLVGYLIWYGRNYSQIQERLRQPYLLGLIWAAGAYVIDLTNMLQITNLPWVNHYSAALYHTFFIVLRRHNLHDWETTAHEFRKQLDTDRLRIAREMHDAIGSDLTQILVGVRQVGDQTLARRLHDRTLSLTEKVRDIVYLLRGPGTLPTLDAFILEHTAFLRQSQRYQMNLELRRVKLEPARSLDAQRIFSEWLSNVIRHSKPKTISISLNERDGMCRLVIGDDGTGLRWYGTRNATGLGNIAERATRLRAKVFSRRGRYQNIFYLKFPVSYKQ